MISLLQQLNLLMFSLTSYLLFKDGLNATLISMIYLQLKFIFVQLLTNHFTTSFFNKVDIIITKIFIQNLLNNGTDVIFPVNNIDCLFYNMHSYRLGTQSNEKKEEKIPHIHVAYILDRVTGLAEAIKNKLIYYVSYW